VFRVHPGQEPAARWFIAWCAAWCAWRAWKTGKGPRAERVVNEKNQETIRSVLFHGGRRGGKTDFAIRAAILFAVLFPKARVWIVSAAIPESEELEANLNEMIPKAFLKGRPLGAPWFRWRLRNGSTISIRTAHDPESLKRGRCDLAVLNEGQKMAKRAYVNVRGGTSDRGGLTIVAANPPDSASGQWIEEMSEEIEAGRRPSAAFYFDARLNPEVDWSALEALKGELDDRTYRQEVLGEFVPRTDIVWHAFRQANVQRAGSLILDQDGRPAPALVKGCTLHELKNVTTSFLKSKFGREYDAAVCLDFQLKPFMAATVRQLYEAPWMPWTKDVLDYTTAEYAIEHGDENDLIDALEAAGLDGKRTLCIADASGEWQDAARTKGQGSFDMFRKRGWRFIYVPDRESKKNPNILDSCKVGNARLCSADGARHSFVDPECRQLIRAFKMWENRLGVPYRRSPYAHLSDAWRYFLWRLYPRRLRGTPGLPTAMGVKREASTRRQEFEAGGL